MGQSQSNPNRITSHQPLQNNTVNTRSSRRHDDGLVRNGIDEPTTTTTFANENDRKSEGNVVANVTLPLSSLSASTSSPTNHHRLLASSTSISASSASSTSSAHSPSPVIATSNSTTTTTLPTTTTTTTTTTALQRIRHAGARALLQRRRSSRSPSSSNRSVGYKDIIQDEKEDNEDNIDKNEDEKKEMDEISNPTKLKVDSKPIDSKPKASFASTVPSESIQSNDWLQQPNQKSKEVTNTNTACLQSKQNEVREVINDQKMAPIVSIASFYHEIQEDNTRTSNTDDHQHHAVQRRLSQVSKTSSVSDMEEEEEEEPGEFADFFPPVCHNFEWMGRSIESLLLGHTARAPILQDEEWCEDDDYDFYAHRRRSTASTFSGSRRRSTAGSFPGGRRSSLSLSGNVRGGTLAMYYRQQQQQQEGIERGSPRRGSTAHGPMTRRRISMLSTTSYDSQSQHASGSNNNSHKAGPNILFHIMAREGTGRSNLPRHLFATQKLRQVGGSCLYQTVDRPAAGIVTEVSFLAAAIDTGDWSETHAIVSRLVLRLVGDPQQQPHDGADSGNNMNTTTSRIDDPNIPPQAHKYYAGGGRAGLERDAFCLAGGVSVLIKMFREKSFVGQEMAYSYDARDLSSSLVASRLATCWNEALVALRELVYYVPSIVTEQILDHGDFLPFLFSLLSHDSCFESGAALIEEIISNLSQTQQLDHGVTGSTDIALFSPRITPATTFYLGDVPDLYRLWRGFSLRQLAHFCRILALLVFEPEDRQLLECPDVLKSLELLQLRRNRAARSGRDSTVDMNQAILLGDEELLKRLLRLLTVMNYAPPLRRFEPYHILSHFPFVADTLIMLGLTELERWDEIDRQDALARQMLASSDPGNDNGQKDEEQEVLLCELGVVADMLTGLSDGLMNDNRQPNQISHILQVISAAQQAGVIVGRGGRSRSRTRRRQRRHRRNRSAPNPIDIRDVNNNGNNPFDIDADTSTLDGLASMAGILTDQLLVRRLYQNSGQSIPDEFGGSATDDARHLIHTPEDAANSLQFNAMLLGNYQVEVLFVLCTLLGGRRKTDAQDVFNRLGVIAVLDDMFQRLPWYWNGQRQGIDDDDNQDVNRAIDSNEQYDAFANQGTGIHGPGCDCTPESALCVQYLRMIHNFCDRDCDNYEGRRLLLSDNETNGIILCGSERNFGKVLIDSERNFIREGNNAKPGLLIKLTQAFIRESDESPYRFWLASCIESFLRGSSPSEQLYLAESGLLNHLVAEISSEKLHCAGSLQTSFDLLGELGKGNADVVELLVKNLDEESFRKLMSVAAANLVDSNVFIRSLFMSLERLSAHNGLWPIYVNLNLLDTKKRSRYKWNSSIGNSARSYLTHSWWDAQSIALSSTESNNRLKEYGDSLCPSDWFPSREFVKAYAKEESTINLIPSGLTESVGHYGWVFAPVGDTLSTNTFLPNTVERLSWFLAANQARLLRDLLGEVDLRNINHENICCLNTAVVIAIFAHRRKQLAILLNELRRMNEEDEECKRRALVVTEQTDVVDRAFAQALRYMDLNRRESHPYARRASLKNTLSARSGAPPQIGDRADSIRNFREVLWFWTEYYTHRGRDRLSLEFSSHIRFQEWSHVVSLLMADDGSSTALVRIPVRLPRSPYQRAARVSEGLFRVE